jgi:membrane protein required for colicin V production
MNPLDIGVIVILLLSAGFAYARGFIREVLAIGAWLGALIVTYYAYGLAAPYAERFLPKGVFANIAAAVVVFVVALVVLSIIAGFIGRRTSQTGMSSFDRIFGFIFGLLRGAVLVSLGYIALAWYMPADKPRPDWVSQARTLPLLESGAHLLEAMVPNSLLERAEATAAPGKGEPATDANRALRAFTQPKPGAATPTPPKTGYSEHEVQDLDRKVDQLQNPNQNQ